MKQLKQQNELPQVNTCDGIVNIEEILLVQPPLICNAGMSEESWGDVPGQSGSVSPAEAHGGQVPAAEWAPKEELPWIESRRKVRLEEEEISSEENSHRREFIE